MCISQKWSTILQTGGLTKFPTMSVLSQIDLWTKRQLIAQCKSYGVSVHGTKQELFDRLQTSHNNDFSGAPPRKRRKIVNQQPSNSNCNVSNVDNNEIDSDDELEEDNDIYPIISSSNLVFLNVGGTQITTSIDTLSKCKKYNCNLSKLTPNTAQRRYFIECDPKYFQYVLEFLQLGENNFLMYTLLNLSQNEIIGLRKTVKSFGDGLYDAIFGAFDGTIIVNLTLAWHYKSDLPLIVSSILPQEIIAKKRCISFEFDIIFTDLTKSDCYLAVVNDYDSNKWNAKNIVDSDPNVLSILHCPLENENTNSNENNNENKTETFTKYFKVWLDFSSCLMSSEVSSSTNCENSKAKTSKIPFKYPKQCIDTLRFCVVTSCNAVSFGTDLEKYDLNI